MPKFMLDYGEGTGNLTFDVTRLRDGKSVAFVQTDWDYPSLARSWGWRGKIGRERCEHRGTDGTAKCPDCGRTATEFITAARDYLDRHVGTVRILSGNQFSDD